MKNASDYLKLDVAATIPWGEQRQEEVVTVSQPAGGSALELPGQFVIISQ